MAIRYFNNNIYCWGDKRVRKINIILYYIKRLIKVNENHERYYENHENHVMYCENYVMY